MATRSWEVDEQGYASLPEGPGLGVEIDEEKRARMHAQRSKKVGRPKPRLDQ